MTQGSEPGSVLDRVVSGSGNIVLFGDSTTALRGKTKTYGELLEAVLLEKNLAVQIINSGVPSNTTSMARKRFQRDVIAHNPALVVIQFGINDAAVDVHKNPPAEGPRVDRETYLSNMEYFIDEVKAQGGEAILMTPNRLCWTPALRNLYGKPPYQPDDADGFNVIMDGYVDGLRELARKKAVRLVDVNAAYKNFPAETGKPIDVLLSDGMHPNDRGHQLVKDLLMEEITK